MSKHPEPSAFDAATQAQPQNQHPVPAIRAATRVDGWTSARQAVFLQALATTHNVTKAARAAGMSRTSAYRLRARLSGQPFDLAWSAAFQSSFDRLAHEAMDRALNGVEVPHYYRGELVGTSRRFDERLTVALLAMRQSFLPDPAPGTHPAAAYDADDFGGLLERVERGPESWDGDDAEDEEEQFY